MSLSTSQLDPDFAKRVDALLAAASQQRWGITLVSAYRSFEEQQVLYNRLKPRGLPVATPGRSCHQFGAAVDVLCKFGFESKQYAEFLRSAQLVNITNPVRNDPGHLQDTELCRQLREQETGPRNGVSRRATEAAAAKRGRPTRRRSPTRTERSPGDCSCS